MKKTVAVALAAAFVVGTSATTFAAANPFSDVPAGHWAYQSVSKVTATAPIAVNATSPVTKWRR